MPDNIHLYARSSVNRDANDSLSKIASRITKNSTVLDVGCATGSLGKFLQNEKQCIVDGIEYNQKAATIAKPYYRSMWVSNLETDKLSDLIGKRKYEYIIFADVLEHLRDPSVALRQLTPFLKSDGKILISIPNISHMGVILELLSGDFRYREEGLLDRTHLRFYTRSSILRFLSDIALSARIVDYTLLDLHHSEFSEYKAQNLSASLIRELRKLPDNLVYQFIVEAVPETNIVVLDEAYNHDAPPVGPCFFPRLYWGIESKPLTDDQSLTIPLPLGATHKILNFHYPIGKARLLRFDPTDQPGVILLHQIYLSKDEQVLWSWDKTKESLLSYPHSSRLSISDSNHDHNGPAIIIANDDHDPWLHIPCPADFVSSANCIKIEVSLPILSSTKEITHNISELNITDLLTIKDNEIAKLKQESIETNEKVATERREFEQRYTNLLTIKDNEIAKLRQENIETNEKAATERREFELRYKAVTTEVAILTSSKSWKVTKPLRIGTKTLREIKRKIIHNGLVAFSFYQISKKIYHHMPLPNKLKTATKGALNRVIIRKTILNDVAIDDDKYQAQKFIENDSNKKSDIIRLIDERFESLRTLRTYTLRNDRRRRVNIVTDSISDGSLYGGVGTALIFSVLLANSLDATLRIITRTEEPIPGQLDKLMALYKFSPKNDIQFFFASIRNTNYEIDHIPGDIFITTSWWTTKSTLGSIPPKSIIYLLQEDERMFYSFGDDRLKCEEIMSNKSIQLVINSKFLYDHLMSVGFHELSNNAKWFEPAFPDSIFYPRHKSSHDKRKFFFYARPNHPRNLFFTGIEVIQDAVISGVIDLSIWDIYFVGNNIPKILLHNDYEAKIITNLTWSEYAEFLGTIDLGLALMYTPHPSYPPLDLAASGAVVVTNRYANKNDMTHYSKNIISADLNRSDLLDAVRRGVKLSTDEYRRNINHLENNLIRDWSLSFETVINFIASTHRLSDV